MTETFVSCSLIAITECEGSEGGFVAPSETLSGFAESSRLSARLYSTAERSWKSRKRKMKTEWRTSSKYREQRGDCVLSTSNLKSVAK